MVECPPKLNVQSINILWKFMVLNKTVRWREGRLSHPPHSRSFIEYFRYLQLLAGGAGVRSEDGRPEEVFSSVRLKLWAIIVDRVSTESIQST